MQASFEVQVPKEGMVSASPSHKRAESFVKKIGFSHCITLGSSPLPSAVSSPPPHPYRTNGWFLPRGHLAHSSLTPFVPGGVKVQPTQSGLWEF